MLNSLNQPSSMNNFSAWPILQHQMPCSQSYNKSGFILKKNLFRILYYGSVLYLIHWLYNLVLSIFHLRITIVIPLFLVGRHVTSKEGGADIILFCLNLQIEH